jgi:repressor LexA
MLTKRQEEVIQFLRSSRQAHGFMPSTREIQIHFGFASQTAAVDIIRALERKGALRRIPGKARGIILSEPNEHAEPVNTFCLPLYGSIAAGYANPSDQNNGEYLEIDAGATGLRSPDNCFALQVRGDSMIGAHILDGDYVILDAKAQPRHHDIVAALIDGETTLKRLMSEGPLPFLRAENPLFPDLHPDHELVVLGVMRGLVRREHARQHALSDRN